jgi:hypothetical protein
MTDGKFFNPFSIKLMLIIGIVLTVCWLAESEPKKKDPQQTIVIKNYIYPKDIVYKNVSTK